MDVVVSSLAAAARAVGRALAGLRPLAILAIGWAVLVVYAYPGYMSFDSCLQLDEARTRQFTDWHPPAMALLWRYVELVVAGPFGMLVLQSVSFLAGAYLLLCRAMSARLAAICACLLLLFPPVSSTMAVIWKDSIMAGQLLLGTALMLSPRRRVKLLGLACLVVASTMRHNALTMTFPLVTLLFVWNVEHVWWKRYGVAIATWLAITVAGQVINSRITVVPQHLWYRTLAPIDIVGTLTYAEPMTDGELRTLLEGTPVVTTEAMQARARSAYNPAFLLDAVWTPQKRMFNEPTTEAERAAIARAWKAIVPTHLGAYLTYRADVFLDVIGLGKAPQGSPIYVWYLDVQDPFRSSHRLAHRAQPGKIQAELQLGMIWLGDSWLFRPYLYLLLALALLGFTVRNRLALALLASALTGEAALFLLGPTSDFRYSFWLVIGTAMTIALVIAQRAGARAAVGAAPTRAAGSASAPRADSVVDHGHEIRSLRPPSEH
jgi:hypothetical protein